ncbi:hypothetical protein [Caldichromatium japonicum]|uniref:hypothetical protein n=1 Tax=Caldichromatium japonicum TaxID=2699430 RepID=UPI001FE5D5B2|nr:hypothetical protein [Caldichromatium japonicum]
MGPHTLWLSGLLAGKERLAVAKRWRQRIGGAGQEFIGLHRRDYAAAREVLSMPEEEGDDPAEAPDTLPEERT